MPGYYTNHLSAERLKACYTLAPPRVQQYLEAEIQHVLSHVRPEHAVLELGCGYGRVLERIADRARLAVGIDSSPASIELARQALGARPNCQLHEMDVGTLAFPDGSFDVVVCIQNGVSAFKVDPPRLLRECLRVARPGGLVLLSSYAAKFWPHRLAWFELQSQHGLLGPIDRDATRDGIIVCQDGFRATTFGPADFQALTAHRGLACQIEEVDQSSIFCEITAPPA